MRKCRVWQLALPSPLSTNYYYNFHPPQHTLGEPTDRWVMLKMTMLLQVCQMWRRSWWKSCADCTAAGASGQSCMLDVSWWRARFVGKRGSRACEHAGGQGLIHPQHGEFEVWNRQCLAQSCRAPPPELHDARRPWRILQTSRHGATPAVRDSCTRIWGVLARSRARHFWDVVQDSCHVVAPPPEEGFQGHGQHLQEIGRTRLATTRLPGWRTCKMVKKSYWLKFTFLSPVKLLTVFLSPNPSTLLTEAPRAPSICCCLVPRPKSVWQFVETGGLGLPLPWFI